MQINRHVTRLTQLALLAAVCAREAASASIQTQQKGIQWGPCEKALEELNPDQSIKIDCANVTVPLDYTDPKCSDTLELQLLRVPALKQPSQGSILFNFGGPGDAGRSSLSELSVEFLAVTGYEHDLVVFDPRGTENTLRFSCYNATELETNAAKYPNYSNASDTALGEIWSSSSLDAQNCYTKLKDEGSLIGTAFVARDLMSVVDALGEDGLLRYWGISYGTVLGATVAAMFPERMDKVLLDAVANSHEYYHSYDLEWISDTDKVWKGFFTECAAAPETCALARPNATAADLEQEFYDFLYQLKYNPIPAGNATLVEYGNVKDLVIISLYSVAGWPKLAATLDQLYKGNGTAYLTRAAAIGSSLTPDPGPGYGIKCGEKQIRTKTKSGMMPHVYNDYNTSQLFGDVFVREQFTCAQWKMQQKEIYQGDFSNITTKTPIFFFSNTYDPLTPLRSAQNMSTGFVGSRLLEQNAYGHDSMSQPSVCGLNAIQNFFVTGELPAEGTVCDSQKDIPPFGNRTIADLIPKLDIVPPTTGK